MPRSAYISIFEGGGGILKLSDLGSLTIFIFGGGGRYSETVFQNRGYSVEFGPKFQTLRQAHASQIVSHILCMWRLISLNFRKTPPVSYFNNTSQWKVWLVDWSIQLWIVAETFYLLASQIVGKVWCFVKQWCIFWLLLRIRFKPHSKQHFSFLWSGTRWLWIVCADLLLTAFSGDVKHSEWSHI